jgi:protocatechuate 3,4-dioxygenase beta subunit
VHPSPKHLSLHGLLFGACLLSISPLQGQSGLGLRGTVVDQSGGGIADASITLFSDNKVRTTKTDKNGEFSFSTLPPHAHWLMASSPGFFSARISITANRPERVSFTLEVGSSSGCFVRSDLAKINGVGFLPQPSPSISYDERSNKVNIMGTVGDAWAGPLAHASLTLTKAEQAPAGSDSATSNVKIGRVLVAMRAAEPAVTAEVISNDKGEFQFSDLEPGMYTLRAAHGGYLDEFTGFWIARGNVTRLSRIYLLPKSEPHVCN